RRLATLKIFRFRTLCESLYRSSSMAILILFLCWKLKTTLDSTAVTIYVEDGDTQSVWTMTDAGLLRVIPPARVRAALAAAAFQEWPYHPHSQPSPWLTPDGGGYLYVWKEKQWIWNLCWHGFVSAWTTASTPPQKRS